MNHTPYPSDKAVWGIYFFAVLLMVWPLVDLLSSSWPLQPGAVEYRYGFQGLLAGFLHTPTLGLVMAMGTAFFMGHGGGLKLLSVLSSMGALTLLIVLILFPLDVLQMRALTPPETHQMMKTGAIIAELKHFTGMIVLLLLGLGGWKTAGWIGAEGRGGAKRKGASGGGGRTSDLAVKPGALDPEPEEDQGV